ncbi:hypothetical protein FDUTEX481_00308 [Tolypothrix sp. PCC 7601]|nr:hypothetical protein FDUTEX481_00308 [Tolypothrix sp. PCC 7601]
MIFIKLTKESADTPEGVSYKLNSIELGQSEQAFHLTPKDFDEFKYKLDIF